MKAMVLAAGFGSRLRPYSLKRPKPLFPLLGKPLLLHTFATLRQAGVTEIIVNCHYLAEQIRELVAPLSDVQLSCEDIELGTGGGLRQAAHLFGDEPLLVVNGDIYHTINLPAVWQRHQQTGAAATLVLHDYPRFNKVSVDGAGQIISFAGQSPGPKLLAFTGIQVINPAILATIPAGVFFNMINCYEQLIGQGAPVLAFEAHGHFWTDMGTPTDYLHLHQKLLTDQRFKGDSSFVIADGVEVDQDQLHDWVVIGAGATIGADARLQRVVVWDGAVVPAGAQLQDAIIT